MKLFGNAPNSKMLDGRQYEDCIRQMAILSVKNLNHAIAFQVNEAIAACVHLAQLVELFLRDP
jgi:hypothetical protein